MWDGDPGATHEGWRYIAMIRNAFIVILTIAALATFALGALSFRLDYDTDEGSEVYGWRSYGIDVSTESTMFFTLERGYANLNWITYIPPSRVVSTMDIDLGVLKFFRIVFQLPDEIQERDRRLGRQVTSQRLG